MSRCKTVYKFNPLCSFSLGNRVGWVENEGNTFSSEAFVEEHAVLYY
jgi:hypothetical protein